MRPEPFEIDIPDECLTDLRERLARTRWPDEIPDSGWDYGANLAYMKELAEYWRSRFDWRAQERKLNELPQFRVTVNEHRLHFVYVRGRGPRPMPLILTHGWPSTFFELIKLIPLLTDPANHGGDAADSFDVVIPSLPGYGFSDRPRRRGFTSMNTAELWMSLMCDTLGYDRFAAHGGDVGAGVTSRLGLRFPDRLIGIHVTAVVRPEIGPDDPPLSDAETAYLRLNDDWERDENGYGHIQGTRPQTLAYGLNDSPVGLASWIIEKYRAWSDCHGDIERRFSKDELLTNISLYWFTQTINPSIRHYYEQRHSPWPFPHGTRVSVPTGVCLTVEPVDRAPREWAERTYDVRRYTLLPRGGHFAAMEEPELLAEDLRSFFRNFREEST
jgi:pimeloyl-ACP methyl ester carboxylesterase